MAGPRARADSGRRARGFGGGDNARFPPMKRWDGVSRTDRDWDKMRRDPEIWERNGNCLVHLYGKGESKRGPSFKLPFSALVAAGCHPFIQRFLVLDGFTLRTNDEIELWDQVHPRSTVEVYVPAPPSSTDNQIFHYQLAVRNFLAWVLGRPMAGEFLGSALVALRESLREFRSEEDHDDCDLMEYMNQAGYLNMAEKPSHALAILHLAETFQMRQLYLEAFAHCVGMHSQLARCTEFQLTSSTSRNLIKEARTTMNSQISQTSFMLRTFLDDDLSETYLGVPPGTRAHLERFRCFLLTFYSRKLGYYPPRTFDAPLLRGMAADFDALYKLLADTSLTGKDTMPPTHMGGICTLQLVQAFDERHSLRIQEHPLPQLPHIEIPNSARLLTWFTRGEKMTTSQRQVTHAALLKSSNRRPDILKNDLVRAYRQFEEDSILAPNKADKNEKVSVLDARKVRWILIYAVHQVLCRATNYPLEVQDQKTTYHLNVPMGAVPPWKAKHVLKDGPAGSTGLSADGKPKMDWVITGAGAAGGAAAVNGLGGSGGALSRTSSISAHLRRSATIRKSLQIFKSGFHSTSTKKQTAVPVIPYHEIIVQGYGNGTQEHPEEGEQTQQSHPPEERIQKGSLACRSDSTASTQSKLSTATESSALESVAGTVDTLPTPDTTPDPSSPVEDFNERDFIMASWSAQSATPTRTNSWHSTSDAVNLRTPRPEASDSKKRYSLRRKRWTVNFDSYMFTPEKEGLQRRHTLMLDMRKKPNELMERLAAVRIRDSEDQDQDQESWADSRVSDDWSVMQAFMDAPGSQEAKDEWAQYADLGGLIDLR
ncbi:hypothetical protein ESCO_000102 [Escovopsis weberi]|uniref:DUF8004 domain-containing protein n=1 Tax=Escovopsis weberi TaxID=150374 RepID=A0A0M8MTN8_ESCWE|nr:hypothetical protein ESCO_000102 [Escovopsis weberi]